MDRPSRRMQLAALTSLVLLIVTLASCNSPAPPAPRAETLATSQEPALNALGVVPGQPPPDVVLTPEEEKLERENPKELQPRFDRFSWETLLALNWPGDCNKRGEPDLRKNLGDLSTLVVWETWKADYELFQPCGCPPTAWEEFACITPCSEGVRVADGGRRKPLAACSKLCGVLSDALGQAEFITNLPQNGPPLIDQDCNYVRYEVRMNKAQYNFIRKNSYYLWDKLPPGDDVPYEKKLAFPPVTSQPDLARANSIQIKAAWRELPDDPTVLARFYHRDAVLIEWDERGKTAPRSSKVGLVGLHIVSKTPTREQWIWSTFEHIDNVPDDPDRPGTKTYSFFKQGKNWKMQGYDRRPEVLQARKPMPCKPPVQVTRREEAKITESAKAETREFHARIRQAFGPDNVWLNYQLIGTQWPARIASPYGSGTGYKAVPRYLANVTMETFEQKTSCLQCHEGARRSRFVAFLEMRASAAAPEGRLNDVAHWDRVIAACRQAADEK